MPLGNYITEGFDPTTIPPGGCLSLADLLQMIHAAVPASPDTGFVVISATTPDTATYPELKRFLWLKSTTGELKYWNGASWQLIASNVSITAASISYEMISPLLGTIPGTAYQLLAVDFSGLTASWHNLSSIIAGVSGGWPDDGYGTQKFVTNLGRRAGVNPAAFVARSISLSKIDGNDGHTAGSPTAGNLLVADGGGGFEYVTPTTAVPAIPDKSISIQKLESTTAAADGSVSAVDKIMAVDASGGMKWIAAPTGIAPGTSGVKTCFTYAWPLSGFAAGSIKNIAHGFNPDTPNYFRGTLSCQIASYGYVTNDEIDLSCVTGDNREVAFTLQVDNTNIYVVRHNAAVINIHRKNAPIGNAVNIGAALTSWALKVYANVLP